MREANGSTVVSPLRVHLARWVCRDVASNLARLRAEVAAVGEGADLVVFPESFLHGYTRRLDPAEARATFAELSSAYPAVVYVFGSISEGGRNRMTVWRGGRQVAAYDKVHLFAPNGERQLWQPGDRYVAVRVGNVTIGLVNCNDLRFPEQCRSLKRQASCTLFVVVAWWPWRRDHVWRTLLRARAIENAAWTLGCCVMASDHPDEPFAGAGSYVFDPHGEAVRTTDDTTYLLDLAGVAPPLVDPVAEAVDVATTELVSV